MTEWVDVAPASGFAAGQSRLIAADNVQIAVFNLEGVYYAVEDLCSHDRSPMLGCGLSPEDIVFGDQIVCPRHGARFCIRTGNALTPPAYEPLASFPVRIENGMVQVFPDR